jgi:hypothetical protein
MYRLIDLGITALLSKMSSKNQQQWGDSMNIDMSKKPEGATHWYPEDGKYLSAWLKVEGATVLYRRPQSSVWRVFEGPAKDLLGAIPIDTPWTGEGLPPVGTVCMTMSSGRERRIKVLGIGKTRLLGEDVETGEEFGFLMINRTFYPIRTPEQIAAEEREAEIGEMSRVIREQIKHYSGQDAADYSAALYDAGYRKQVAK